MPIKVVGQKGTKTIVDAIKANKSKNSELGEDLSTLTQLVSQAMTDLDTEEITDKEVEALWNS